MAIPQISVLSKNLGIFNQCRTGTADDIRQLIKKSSTHEQDNIFQLCAEFGHLILLQELASTNPDIVKKILNLYLVLVPTIN